MDPDLCLPAADPNHTITVGGVTISAGRSAGSGINPDLAVHCDPTLLLCVLNKEPPAFK
jgi:hypothetical protein